MEPKDKDKEEIKQEDKKIEDNNNDRTTPLLASIKFISH